MTSSYDFYAGNNPSAEQNEAVQATRVFLCPFNGYHKIFDGRKFQFHIARCKDRRGKSVFHCQYYHGHIYIDLQELLKHEKECLKRPCLTKIENNEDGEMDDGGCIPEEEQKQRQPSVCYCPYNVDHQFKSVKERQTHELTCPQREEYTRKITSSQQVYQKHKLELKKASGNRKTQHQELYGHCNGPTALEMPTLKYKYRMNEPFLAGEQGQFAISHEQNEFKKKYVYCIKDDAEKEKTQEEELNDMKDERAKDLADEFKGRPTPDINFFTVKHDQEAFFSLKIESRHSAKAYQLFDFDIDEYISLLEFRELLQLPRETMQKWSADEWKSYLNEHTLMKLNISDTDDENQGGYRELAKQQLEQFHQVCLVEKNESSRRTILKNTSRSNQLYHELGDSKQSYLFLINRSTEFLGQHLDHDFVLLSFITDAPESESPQTKMERNMAGVIKIPELMELESEKQELESRLKEATTEIKDLSNAQETQEKIIRDKERQARSDKKQIDFLENDRKHIRGDLRNTQEMLNDKETEVRNLEKELEQKKCEIKSIQMRFDREKLKSEQFQDKYNKTEVKLSSALQYLSEANKALKHKDISLHTSEQKVKDLQNIIKQFTQLKDGKSLSAGAIQENVTFQQPVQITLSGGIQPSNVEQQIKSETQPSAPAETEEKQNATVKTAPKPTCEPGELAEMIDASDGEIMDGEENVDTIKMNKIQQVAATTLRNQNKSKSRRASGRGTQKHSEAQAPLDGVIKQNPEDDENHTEESKTAENNSCTKGDKLPHDMLCVICFAARKTVMIMTCKHLVFCKGCELDFALKYPNNTQCPICRKEYKKTIPILYS